MSATILFTFLLVGITVAVAVRKTAIHGVERFQVGSKEAPSLYWVLDDGDGNARRWVDFGARLSTDPNLPFTNMTLRRLQEKEGGDFNVIPLVGRLAVRKLLQSAGCKSVPRHFEIAPAWLWRAWTRAALQYHVGGGYIDAATLVLETHLRVQTNEKDLVILSCAPETGDGVAWASVQYHPVWGALYQDLCAVMEAGPNRWSSAEARLSLKYLFHKYLHGHVTHHQEPLWCVDESVLLSKTAQKPPRFTSLVSIDQERVCGSAKYGWFCRMSEQQIRDSDFVWAKLLL